MNTAPETAQGELHDNMDAAVRAQQMEYVRPSTALVAAPNPFQTMAMVAMEKGNMDQFEKLLDLQLRWDAEQSRKAFVSALAAAKAEPINITKSRAVGYTTDKGDFVGYRHASLADVVDGVVGAMGMHGLSHRWDVRQEDGQVSVTCILSHRDGHSETVTMTAAPDNSGKKNPIQQVSSTVTYLQRYTLTAAFGVAASDIGDDDGVKGGEPEPAPVITPEQVKTLEDLVAAYVKRPEKFMEWIRGAADMKHVQELGQIPATRFDFIHAQLGRIRQQQTEAADNG